jgi:hypothetical protein
VLRSIRECARIHGSCSLVHKRIEVLSIDLIVIHLFFYSKLAVEDTRCPGITGLGDLSTCKQRLSDAIWRVPHHRIKDREPRLKGIGGRVVGKTCEL